MEDITDRQSFVPPHEGPNILPNIPLFSRLLNHASVRNSVCIKEVEATFSVSQLQLLTDVLWLRNALQASLDEESQKKLRNGHEYYIALLAPGGYEYTVGFLAIIACGAAVVPLSEFARFSVSTHTASLHNP
jgi:malonyl-CoA/methylmalonyl-CoA synthetase